MTLSVGEWGALTGSCTSTQAEAHFVKPHRRPHKDIKGELTALSLCDKRQKGETKKTRPENCMGRVINVPRFPPPTIPRPRPSLTDASPRHQGCTIKSRIPP